MDQNIERTRLGHTKKPPHKGAPHRNFKAKDLVSDHSDDEDVEYKGHFCSGCSIPPPGGVRGWVRGYDGVGLWEAGPGCACCEDYD